MYEKRIILFLDILGFQEKLSKPEELVKAVKLLKETLRPRDGEKRYTEFDFIQFSDLIVISAKPTRLASAALFIIRTMLRVNILVHEHGIPVRGSIVCGDYHYKDEILISPALAEAYKLESKFARYPRVLVSDSLMDFCSTLPELPGRLSRFQFDFDTITMIDNDGFRFLNYLHSTGAVETDAEQRNGIDIVEKMRQLEAHRNFVIKNLIEHKSNEIREKYIWMANYHNRYVTWDPFLDFKTKRDLLVDQTKLRLNF